MAGNEYSIFNSVHTFGKYERKNGYRGKAFKNDKMFTFFVDNGKAENEFFNKVVSSMTKKQVKEADVTVPYVIAEWKVAIDNDRPTYLLIDVRVYYND